MSHRNPLETVLGIKNFKNDYLTIVQSLADITPINPTIEKLDRPETFNSRFLQLGQGIRHAFNAAGEIAIRDKKYLETFLSGYTNPIVSSTFDINAVNIKPYDNNSSFDVNGNLIRFPEERVMFNISTLAQISTQATYHWLFVNGKYINHSEFTIHNTSYGIKAFIKKSALREGDRITVTLNRKYNVNSMERSSKVVPIPRNTSTFSTVIPTNEFGSWYHTDYLKVYLKRSGNYSLIPLDKITAEPDVVSGSVRLTINGYNLLTNDELVVQNSIYYWEHIKTNTPMNQWQNEIILKDPETGRPIPFQADSDFDIFLDGVKLIPLKDYGVVEKGTPDGFPVLKFFTRPSNPASTSERFNLYIYKNEATRKEYSDYVYEETLSNDYNLIQKDEDALVPFMGRLGYTYAGGKLIPHSDLEVLERTTMYLGDNNKSKSDVFHQTKIVYTYDIKDIVEYARNETNDFDRLVNLIGRDKYLEYLMENATIKPIGDDADLTTNVGLLRPKFNSIGNSNAENDSENLEAYMNIRTGMPSGLVVDTNEEVSGHVELKSYFEGDLVLDANVFKSSPETYDANNR